MSSNLVIVESPAKARTIEKYLGGDFKVMASYGHVRDLPSKDGAVVRTLDEFTIYHKTTGKLLSLDQVAQEPESAVAFGFVVEALPQSLRMKPCGLPPDALPLTRLRVRTGKKSRGGGWEGGGQGVRGVSGVLCSRG